MSEQCNTCGTHENLIQCSHCPTTICEHCKLQHEPYCEELQKAKRRGEGPTIGNVPVPAHRAGHETPPTTEPDQRGRRLQFLAASPEVLEGASVSFVPADKPTLSEEHISESLRNFIDPGGVLEGMSFGLPYKAALALEAQTSADHGLEAIKDLLADGQ